jgi:hypothetical protein
VTLDEKTPLTMVDRLSKDLIKLALGIGAILSILSREPPANIQISLDRVNPLITADDLLGHVSTEEPFRIHSLRRVYHHNCIMSGKFLGEMTAPHPINPKNIRTLLLPEEALSPWELGTFSISVPLFGALVHITHRPHCASCSDTAHKQSTCPLHQRLMAKNIPIFIYQNSKVAATGQPKGVEQMGTGKEAKAPLKAKAPPT